MAWHTYKIPSSIFNQRLTMKYIVVLRLLIIVNNYVPFSCEENQKSKYTYGHCSRRGNSNTNRFQPLQFFSLLIKKRHLEIIKIPILHNIVLVIKLTYPNSDTAY